MHALRPSKKAARGGGSDSVDIAAATRVDFDKSEPIPGGSDIRVEHRRADPRRSVDGNRLLYKEMSAYRRAGQAWLAGCSSGNMDFSTVVDRVRDDFNEMPGLELTLPQAIRLWNLGADDCRYAVDALVDAGFLKWTARRTIVRTGRTLGRDDVLLEYVPVRSSSGRNNFVGS